MDRLVAEKETEEKIKIHIPKVLEKTEESQSEKIESSSYVNSFENLTVADIRRQEQEKEAEEFKLQKEQFIQKQFETSQEDKKQEVSQNIIEKPNYDFIEENKKIVKLKKKEKPQKKANKKLAGILLSCALGASAVVCIANTMVIDQMNSNFMQIEDTYQFNLAKYLKNIQDLDTTKKGMEFVETYPEEILDAGDIGQSSNWFDKLCSFLGGLFGG